MADMTLQVIADDDDWLELRDGQHGVVRGRLYGTLIRGAAGLLITTSGWSLIAIELRAPWSGEETPAGRSVSIRVERIEDGLTAGQDDITFEQGDL